MRWHRGSGISVCSVSLVGSMWCVLCALHVSCSVCQTEAVFVQRLILCLALVAGVQVDDSSVKSHGLKIWSGSVLLAMWLAVLIVTVVLGSTLANPPPPLLWWQVFYRTGGEQGHQQGLAVLIVRVTSLDSACMVVRASCGPSEGLLSCWLSRGLLPCKHYLTHCDVRLLCCTQPQNGFAGQVPSSMVVARWCCRCCTMMLCSRRVTPGQGCASTAPTPGSPASSFTQVRAAVTLQLR